MDLMRQQLTAEQRESVRVLLWARWALLAALLVVIDYPLTSDPRGFAVVASLLGLAAASNLDLQLRIRGGRPVALAAPLAAGVFDAVAITTGIAVIDGFDNTAYVLYYPALMAFAAVFPGRISLTYSAAIIAVYSTLSVFAYERFDRTTAADWHDLGLRVSTMGVTVLIGYLLVRLERTRRVRAVLAEGRRQQEVFALEERAREAERAGEAERRRLVREVHDGVSQGIYVLSLGLENAQHQLAAGRRDADEEAERLAALVRLSKQTLLDSRGLLFDLSQVMSGETSLEALVTNQANEFRAITGIATTVSIEGTPSPSEAGTVAEVYRVLREGLTNIYRHSGASAARIELCYKKAGATLRVTDDGDGFDTEGGSTGHGLRTMGERAALFGGRLAVSSTPGAGTVLTLDIPTPGVEQ